MVASIRAMRWHGGLQSGWWLARSRRKNDNRWRTRSGREDDGQRQARSERRKRIDGGDEREREGNSTGTMVWREDADRSVARSTGEGGRRPTPSSTMEG